MSCNISYKNGKISVLDDLGNPSKLYKSAVDKFGEEKGLEMYLVSKSNSFLDFFAPKTTTEFTTEVDDDRTEIFLENRGNVVVTETFPEYEFLEDITEKQADKLGISEGDFISKIEHVEVEQKGKGLGRKLMNEALHLINDRNAFPVYLNASPMGTEGLPLEALTKFYQSFGFKVFKKQGGNNLMLLTKEDLKLEPRPIQEPTLQEVTNYIASNNRTKAELNQNQKADLINVLISNPDFKAEDFYDEFGMFVIPKKHYSRYELLTLENQEQIKEAVDALLNTDFTPNVEVTGNIEQINEKNAFGKLVNLNPNISEKEKLREQVLNGEREDYKTAEVFIETLDGELISAKNNNTEQILPLVVKETFKTDLVSSLETFSLSTLQQGEEQTRIVLKAIENDLISQGIDAIGLSQKPIDEELVDFLNTAKTFINSPTKENTKTFAEKSDTYFERDLEPKVDVVKSDKTDRNYIKLNTNLTEEHLYEKKGLIQSELGKGIYIQTAKESLEDLYNNLRTYTEKYPKGTPLEQYVQEQISEMNYDNAENAEAIVLYKMYFNINNKENENKQLSPTEEQGRSTAGRIAEEATNILRGSKGTSKQSSARDKQIDKLRVWSYDNGYYIEDYESIGDFLYKGMESQVYYNPQNNSVIKVNDLEFYDTPLEYLDSIAIHNQLFPEAPYTVKGFTTRQDTFEFAVIVEQPFIRADRGATNLEVFEELSKMGYSKIGENMYTNGRYTIEDLHEGNILVDENNNLFFIDPVVRINTENSTDNAIRSVQKQFTGNYNYLTEDYVSDFYIEQLKEKQKNSAKYRNFYSNFEINEKGINLLNTDDITMQQIEIYADDNLRQYSLLSKQMPDLKVDDVNENQRDLIVNNPQTLEDYKKDLFRVNDSTIILKDNTETFVKVNGEIYENVETDSNLSVFAKVESEVSDYYQYNIKQPKTNIKLSDYSYLATQEELFTSPKKYLKQEEKNQIKNDKFNC